MLDITPSDDQATARKIIGLEDSGEMGPQKEERRSWKKQKTCSVEQPCGFTETKRTKMKSIKQ